MTPHDDPFYVAAYLFLTIGVVGYALFTFKRRAWFKRLASWSGPLAFLGIVLGLIVRGIHLGYLPLFTNYEFALALVAAVLLVHFVLERRAGPGTEGAISLLLAFLLATYFLWLTPASARVAGAPVPFLRSPWFLIHALSVALGYGAFAVAGGMGIAYLCRAWFPSLGWLPEEDDLDSAGVFAVRIGFPWMTLGIVTGGIWALLTWATFWTWDPKETWALIVWLIYLFHLHARALPNWPGKRTAIISVIGLAAVLFAFLGTKWLARTIGVDIMQVQ